MSEAIPIQRVLQVHTRYRQLGGEDHVVEAERQLLESAGISVRQVLFDNADLLEGQSLLGDVRIAAATIWSRSAARRVSDALREHGSQIVHVHNTFLAASPSVYAAAATHGIPVVQTLHNYRLFCPSGTAFRDAHACTDCLGRSIAWPAVVHACYRGSRAQSALVSATLAVHRGLGTFSRRIDAFVVLTAFQRNMMVAAGLPEGRIRIVPNFFEPDPGVGSESRAGFLYVGRLAEEKGIPALLDAAGLEPGLVRVAGAGPLAPVVRRAASAGYVDYLGELDHDSVVQEMRRAWALVVPSIWFEGFPLVVLEAYATATPVIASGIGSLAEIVQDGVTGLLAEPGDPGALASRLQWARDHPEEMRQMGSNARRLYEARYRGATHLAALLDAYQAVIAEKARVTVS